MTQLDDPRLVFFVEHATQIREWAALEAEVNLATNEFLDGFLATWPSFEPPTGSVAGTKTGQYAHAYLANAAWFSADQPLVQVALSWDRRQVGLDQETCPYVGVTTNPTTPDGKARSDALRLALDDHRRRTGAESTRWWPSSRRVPVTTVEPEIDLDQYALRLVDALLEEWASTSAAVHEVIMGGPLRA